MINRQDPTDRREQQKTFENVRQTYGIVSTL